MLNTRFYALMGIYIVQLLILIYLRIYFLNVMKNIVKSYKKVKSTIPNKNSFDPDICGSKRPTYPEKESNRFEELIQKIESLVLKQDNLDDRALLSKCCYELKDTTNMYNNMLNEEHSKVIILEEEKQCATYNLKEMSSRLDHVKKESVKLRRKNINLKSSRATKYNQLFYFVKEYQRLEKQNSYLNESNAHLGEDYAVSEVNNTDLKKKNQELKIEQDKSNEIIELIKQENDKIQKENEQLKDKSKPPKYHDPKDFELDEEG